MPERDSGRVFKVYLQQGDIGGGVGANDFGLFNAAVGQLHENLLSTIDHMVIGDEVAARIDNHA